MLRLRGGFLGQSMFYFTSESGFHFLRFPRNIFIQTATTKDRNIGRMDTMETRVSARMDGIRTSIIVVNLSDLMSFADPRLLTLLQGVGVELEDDWTVEQKRKVFLGAIGVMQLPTL
ncbi:hypothetical protein FANTH_13673 [Fusarium anthophilum]|uniref:Uncharacterized protein n=1 Tax=Fusarium anthophilum TaxID=48485 RepID=A0A8H4YMF9_9HYPO|nr:hypothetical protein FANTH_13673 [Fusarium anthophilum]